MNELKADKTFVFGEECEAYKKSEADKVIAELRDAQHWRKFSEEKPEWGKEVLVIDKDKDIHIVRFSHDFKWISWGKMNTCESDCITHWMPLPSAPKEGKMIEPKLTVSNGTVSPCIEIDKRHIEAIAHEYWAAKEKHPKFCDDFSRADVEIVRDNLEFYRKANEGTQHADLVLLEEFYEAVEAYMNGDKKQCLKELAQCGGVIIRMMDFVKKEMEGR